MDNSLPMACCLAKLIGSLTRRRGFQAWIFQMLTITPEFQFNAQKRTQSANELRRAILRAVPHSSVWSSDDELPDSIPKCQSKCASRGGVPAP